MKNAIYLQRYQSPCGELLLGSWGEQLCLCDWTGEERRKTIDRRIEKELQATFIVATSPVIDRAITQLNEYFGGKRRVFDIPLLLIGTPFQKAVWSELLKIPFGQTVSYAMLSQRLNSPKAVRAVASANGANAISIFVPCHRVIGSNGQLTGYAGGLPAKKLLIDLESPLLSFAGQ